MRSVIAGSSVPSASAVSPPAPVDSNRLVVRVLDGAPDHFGLDGDLDEWPAVEATPGTTIAASHVDVVITTDGALLAGELQGSAARDGAWVALLFPPPGGAGKHECPLHSGPLPKPFLAAPDECFLAIRQCQFGDAFYGRFQHTFGIDERGVFHFDGLAHELDMGISFKSSKRGDGFTFEARVPLELLPASSQAPLRRFGTADGIGPIGSGGHAPVLTMHSISPIGLGAFAEARAAQLKRSNSDQLLYYFPADDDTTAAILCGAVPKGSGRTLSLYAVSLRTVDWKASVGDIDVGSVIFAESVVAVRQGGRHKAVFDLGGGAPWVAKVGNEIRVASASALPSTGAEQWSFRTLIVQSDGTMASDELSADELWSKATLIHSPDLGLLGIRGTVLDGFTPRAGKTTWRLDTKTHQYLGGAQVP